MSAIKEDALLVMKGLLPYLKFIVEHLKEAETADNKEETAAGLFLVGLMRESIHHFEAVIVADGMANNLAKNFDFLDANEEMRDLFFKEAYRVARTKHEKAK